MIPEATLQYLCFPFRPHLLSLLLDKHVGLCSVQSNKKRKKGGGVGGGDDGGAEEEPLVLTPIQLPDAADPFLFFPHHNPFNDICSHFGKNNIVHRE